MLLLRRNIVSPEQLLQLTHAMRQATNPEVPIIAIDQEGGMVARLDATNGFSPWPSASEVASQDLSDEELYDLYAARAREMAFVGINLNLGPVLDLNVNPRNPIIGALGRSYGHDPEAVARYAAAFIRAHRTAGVLTCAKHYPGHGSSTTDSHVQRTEINLSWTSAELLPFRMMIERGDMDSLMTAHVIHRRFSDDGNTPVSISRTAIDLARSELGFDGPILTDDMQMMSITTALPEDDAAIAAVRAGNTFLVYANHRHDQSIQTVERVVQHISNGLATGQIDPRTWETRIDVAKRFQSRFKAGLRL